MAFLDDFQAANDKKLDLLWSRSSDSQRAQILAKCNEQEKALEVLLYGRPVDFQRRPMLWRPKGLRLR